MKYSVRSDKRYSIQIEKSGGRSGHFTVSSGKDTHSIQVKETHPDGRLKTITINNKIIPVQVTRRADGFPKSVLLNGIPFDVDIEKVKSVRYKPAATTRKICGDVKASLPGQILAILVNVGDRVQKGQPVVILESMKMENEITSPKSGTIQAIHINVGQLVMKNEVMIEMD